MKSIDNKVSIRVEIIRNWNIGLSPYKFHVLPIISLMSIPRLRRDDVYLGWLFLTIVVSFKY